MDIKYFKSGDYSNQHGYMSFYPNPIDGDWNINIPEIITLLEEASLKLGALNAYINLVPEVGVFINMFVLKEACHSCSLAGNKLRIEDAILNLKDISPDLKNNWQEVHNYTQLLNASFGKADKPNLSIKHIKDSHKLLLKGVKTKNKSSGEFRQTHSWIGGDNIKDAVFVPPHHVLIMECMTDLLKFLNNAEIKVPRLIRIGIAYYQFETIQAFPDRNGGIVRLMILFYFKEQKLLNKTGLFLSEYFEKHKQHYEDLLLAVSLNNKLEQWLIFFLKGIIESAQKSVDIFNLIIFLRDKVEKRILLSSGKRLPNAKLLLSYLYLKPIVTVADVMVNLKLTKQTANVLIADFFEMGILKEQTGGKRNRVFVFEEYLNYFK